ncbi:MAG: hypothetical protein NC548_35590 [Lachnospiraceae bacterium]|nr:hypothetical protein [Lachnospiraceae bacterium]MCM1232706.1 hypothetical protein [Ruminococcus flavefaciens]
MEISDKVRKAYYNSAKAKRITLYFPELDITIGRGRFYQESMSLSEQLVDSQSIEFVGCISSKFKIQVHNLKEDIKGKKIVVTIHTDDTEDEPIPLFSGIVDSAMKQSNKRIKEITAYDELYTRGNAEVTPWYKSLVFPATLKQIRDSLFDYIGLTQVEISLPNDDITIDKQYAPKSLQALSVIKSICQINGAFGIINRQGHFEYRILGKIEDSGLYPGFYPGADAFPGISTGALGLDDISPEEFPFYRTVQNEEFKVKPVDKITIRQSEDEDGVTYGSGDNNYIIQGNMFTYGISADALSIVAANIYPNVQGFSYYPFRSENSGLPYLECGLDAASYMMIDWEKTENSNNVVYKQENFYILNRELTGIQALKDSYSAQGEEYQTEFITDLQTQIDSIKNDTQQIAQNTVKEYTYSKAEIDEMGNKKWYKIVTAKPTSFEQGVIYFVRK